MKKVLCFALCISFLFSCLSFSSFASPVSDRSMQVLASDGRTAHFTIKSTVKDTVKREDLKRIADNNPDSNSFIIYDKVYANKSDDFSLRSWSPVFKTYLNENYLQSDRFMASCAKGETKTITHSFESSLSPGYTGNPVGISLKATITYTITVGTVLVGPPEGSYYNCREFRCEFYESGGTWEQWYGVTKTMGTFTEPTYYHSYSKDIYIP